MLREMIGSEDFKRSYRQNEKAFIRSRILPFVGLVVSQINLLSKSVSVEISKFVERFFGRSCDYTKQAFSQSRRKLKAEAFMALNQQLISAFYADGKYKQWYGYRLLAIDGSLVQLPESAELISTFGLAENKGNTMPMGRSSFLYDVENELIVDARLQAYKASEQQMARQHLNYLQDLSLPGKNLLLFDRGYPSLWLLACLQDSKLDFVIRCNASFLRELKAFAGESGQQALLELDMETPQRKVNQQLQQFLQPGQTKLRVRAVKVNLPTAQTAYLLTSLQEIELSAFQQLYHRRWEVETGIDFQKNVAQVENFSAKTALGVRQDFQAHMLAVNLSALLVLDAQQEMEQEQALKHNKHIYKVNRAVALGLVKDQLPNLLMGQEPIEQLYQQLKGKIKRRKEAVRTNRSFPRKRKLRYKFHLNKRPVI